MRQLPRCLSLIIHSEDGAVTCCDGQRSLQMRPSSLSTVPEEKCAGSSRSYGAGRHVRGYWGPFHRTLCSLGCWMEDTVPDNAQEYTPEQARTHMLSIGGEANNVDIDAVVHRMPLVATYWKLDDLIGWHEFVFNLRRMKESPARSAHEIVQQAVLEVINHMMLKDDPWNPMAVRSVVILLWKQKGSQADLNQYRGISLLSMLAGVAHLCSEQGRPTIDPSFICRVLMETAATRCPVAHSRSICFLLMKLIPACLAPCVGKSLKCGRPAVDALEQLDETTLSLPAWFEGGVSSQLCGVQFVSQSRA